MALPSFDLIEPRTLREAGEALARLGGRGRVLAGGTDLFIDLQGAEAGFTAAVSLMSVRGLDEIAIKNGKLVVGVTATMTAVAESRAVREALPVLAEAAASMGCTQIRNAATVGGNVANAVPSADIPPCLVAAGASVQTYRAGKRRTVKMGDLFTGPRSTVLGRDEILTRIVVPALPPRTGVAYEKFVKRGANVVAVASSAARIGLGRGKIVEPRIVLGAVAPTPMRARTAEDVLAGEKPSEELFEEAARAAAGDARPISDVRAGAEFRRHLVRVLTGRALGRALERARGGAR